MEWWGFKEAYVFGTLKEDTYKLYQGALNVNYHDKKSCFLARIDLYNQQDMRALAFTVYDSA